MFLEGVIVSVNCGDFLSYSLPVNKSHFDDLVVVTSPEDKVTISVCEENGVKCVYTEDLFKDGAVLRKGFGINYGLSNLSKQDWVLHLDADICLPHNFRDTLEKLALDPEVLYGTDRRRVDSYLDYLKVMPYLEAEQEVPKEVENLFPIGAETNFRVQVGYIPIGFFQLWNIAKTGRVYPETSNDASVDDVKMSYQWITPNRKRIREACVYHLDSMASPMATNWFGRRTPLFGNRVKLVSKEG